MAERLVATRASTIDILDRVLDKGIVIDGWWRISVAGLDLISVGGQVVVASIDTYLRHAPIIARTGLHPWREMEILCRPAALPGPARRTPTPPRRRTSSRRRR
jgi:gas vesicle structural protein